MERRQNGGERRKIVQEFLLKLKDETERAVCHMYLADYRDGVIREKLKLSKQRLEEIKAGIRSKLIAAGIKL